MSTESPKPESQHFQQIQDLWGIEGEIRFIRRVENFVYETQWRGKPVILRLTETRHRSEEELAAELDWMDYLARSGLSVATPISSRQGKLVEALTGGQIYLVSVFEKAEGGPLDPVDFKPEVFEVWGTYVGRLHSLTRDYRPSPGIVRRSLWNEDSGFQVTLRGLDEKDFLPYKRFQELITWLGELDTGPQAFGLVHCDLHHGNFFVNDGRITAFDFDDCCYHWLTHDLATPLCAVLRLSDEGALSHSHTSLLDAYLSGYHRTGDIEPIWIQRLELFIKFRIASVYHWAKASRADGIFDDKGLEWCQRQLAWSLKYLQPELKFF